jgi:sphingomyelin phosphodiesterase
LHLSDIHIDFEYQPGALADCDQPLCCRNISTTKRLDSLTGESFAGFWGDYRSCDIPLWTVEDMFDHISKHEKVKTKLLINY